jgi:hypothetical protein
LLAAVLDSPVSLLSALNFFAKLLEKVLDVVRRSSGELLDASLLLLLSKALGLDAIVGVHREPPFRLRLIKSLLEER